MYTLYVDGVVIRPLANGDTAVVEALFARLGERSRIRRFGGAKPRLSGRELEELARVDATRHAVVAYLAGDPAPAGIGRLVRHGAWAEVAFAVADVHQGRGIGVVLLRELAALARAAGIEELRATICGDNPPAIALMTHHAEVRRIGWLDGAREVVVAA